MIKLSDVLNSLVQKNHILQFGMSEKLFNLTALAEFLQSDVELRLKRDVSKSSILMALSRMQQNVDTRSTFVPKFEIIDLALSPNLCVCTLNKTAEYHKLVHKFYSFVQSHDAYCDIMEGLNEITIIFANKFVKKLKGMLKDEPKFIDENVTGVILTFDEKYMEVPGFMFAVLQSVFLQNINLVEISSSYTELILYVKAEEAKLTFNTLYELLV